MDPSRISALLTPFAAVSPELSSQLSTYLDLLLRWNARMNLTAVRDADEIITRHFGESLFVARSLFNGTEQGRLVDLGSGAGFPGVPIKLEHPALETTLVEANYRKTIFLREVLRALRLEGISVFHGRAESFSAPPAPLTVTLRAVERFQEILPLAAGLLRTAPPAPAGSPATLRRLALLIGESQVRSARTLLPDFDWQDPVPIPQSASRTLLVGSLQFQVK